MRQLRSTQEDPYHGHMSEVLYVAFIYAFCSFSSRVGIPWGETVRMDDDQRTAVLKSGRWSERLSGVDSNALN